MRKTKEYKENKLKFEANLITVKKLISMYTQKTIPVILALKINKIKNCITDIEQLNHLSELISLDIPNHKAIFDVLSSIWSIDNNEIIHDKDAMQKFPELLLELIDEEYIKDIMKNYDKNKFKIDSYLTGQETIAKNIGDEEYGLFMEA